MGNSGPAGPTHTEDFTPTLLFQGCLQRKQRRELSSHFLKIYQGPSNPPLSSSCCSELCATRTCYYSFYMRENWKEREGWREGRRGGRKRKRRRKRKESRKRKSWLFLGHRVREGSSRHPRALPGIRGLGRWAFALSASISGTLGNLHHHSSVRLDKNPKGLLFLIFKFHCLSYLPCKSIL